MAQVEIARFDSDGVAQLAVRFLQSHGITATAPYFPHSRSIGTAAGIIGETPLLVEESQAADARMLFERVVAGEFADEDPTRGSKGGLGAALAEAILPAAAFRPPTSLQGLAPVFIIGLVLIAAVVGRAIFQFVTT